MTRLFAVLLAAICFACFMHTDAIHVAIKRHCTQEVPGSGLSLGYSENIAHAVHSMTVQGLRIFNPRATEKNSVPTVNHNVTAPNKVVPFAPDSPFGSDFTTLMMNMMDKILSNVGKANDGLGPFWSPLERVAHNFHMWDLWEKTRQIYDETVLSNPPSDNTCSCVLDVTNNGVYGAVKWVADHYKAGTPITLLDRPIPKLTNAATWQVWRERLLHYYTRPALEDAAIYLYCATRDF